MHLITNKINIDVPKLVWVEAQCSATDENNTSKFDLKYVSELVCCHWCISLKKIGTRIGLHLSLIYLITQSQTPQVVGRRSIFTDLQHAFQSKQFYFNNHSLIIVSHLINIEYNLNCLYQSQSNSINK